jgi:hypothetical protein
MCVTITKHYWGCKANNFNMKECTQSSSQIPCEQDPCPGYTVRQAWQRGVCLAHIPKLRRDEQQGARDFLEASDERWNNGEYRVRKYYVKGKLSDWYNAGNKCVVQ